MAPNLFWIEWFDIDWYHYTDTKPLINELWFNKNEVKKIKEYLKINQNIINIEIINEIKKAGFTWSFIINTINELSLEYDFYKLNIIDLIDLIEIYKSLLNNIEQLTDNKTPFKLKYLFSETIERFELINYSNSKIVFEEVHWVEHYKEKFKKYIDLYIWYDDFNKVKSISKNTITKDKQNIDHKEILIDPKNDLEHYIDQETKENTKKAEEKTLWEKIWGLF